MFLKFSSKRKKKRIKASNWIAEPLFFVHFLMNLMNRGKIGAADNSLLEFLFFIGAQG